MINALRRFKDARRMLRRRYDVQGAFADLEESCIPSYTHRNPLIAWVAWTRLETARRMCLRHVEPRRVLDFGSGSGVLRGMLPDSAAYAFVEQDEALAARVLEDFPNARRTTLAHAEAGRFDTIFALDSLEHNVEIDAILRQLADRLADNGVFVLSGPSENLIYRAGRFLAGFKGGYHHQTIYDVERAAERHFRRVDTAVCPFGLPLFRVTAWRHRKR